MSVRTDLAEAIDAIEGLHCTPFHRQTSTPFEAMVRLDRSARDDSGFGFMDTWQVLVILPQNIALGEQWVETNRDALIDAAAEHIIVTGLTPNQLPVDNTLVPCVVLEGVREN